MSYDHTKTKKRIAVLFGGRSPEHDVSVITGLQILNALDSTKYESFPVYITTDGVWLTGDVLRKRENFLPDKTARAACTEVILDVTAGRTGRLIPRKQGFFKSKPIEFDAAIPSFHGLYGEDGNIQGLLEFAGIPYAGMRTMASSILMDKMAGKYFMHALGIPVLPAAVLKRPESGFLLPAGHIRTAMKNAGICFPCILKPVHLGSSIGVAKVINEDEIIACLPAVFEYDDAAMLEPFVPNLAEYNVAVARINGIVRTSAFERPKAKDELLDFKAKYLSGGGGKSGAKSGTKTPGQGSEGMLSLTRELNPKLPPQTEENMRRWVTAIFEALDGSGAPRVDFISNAATGEVWMNEINPWPGSVGYFLWEAASDSILFSELLDILVDEAFTLRRGRALPSDPVPVGARLLKRPAA
jgi:D-alanine-D-alanine ligase